MFIEPAIRIAVLTAVQFGDELMKALEATDKKVKRERAETAYSSAAQEMIDKMYDELRVSEWSKADIRNIVREELVRRDLENGIDG